MGSSTDPIFTIGDLAFIGGECGTGGANEFECLGKRAEIGGTYKIEDIIYVGVIDASASAALFFDVVLDQVFFFIVENIVFVVDILFFF